MVGITWSKVIFKRKRGWLFWTLESLKKCTGPLPTINKLTETALKIVTARYGLLLASVMLSGQQWQFRRLIQSINWNLSQWTLPNICAAKLRLWHIVTNLLYQSLMETHTFVVENGKWFSSELSSSSEDHPWRDLFAVRKNHPVTIQIGLIIFPYIYIFLFHHIPSYIPSYHHVYIPIYHLWFAHVLLLKSPSAMNLMSPNTQEPFPSSRSRAAEP